MEKGKEDLSTTPTQKIPFGAEKGRNFFGFFYLTHGLACGVSDQDIENSLYSETVPHIVNVWLTAPF